MILTHGRPDNQPTLRTLKRGGYTGKVFLVIDDEDKTAPRYHEIYGDKVITFSKQEIAETHDEADNFNDRRAIFYARNASFHLARKVGCRYFIQLDDDYKLFMYRRQKGWIIKGLDGIFEGMVRFMETTPAKTVAMSQGGDHIGMAYLDQGVHYIRKAMNSFVCDVERPFTFVGRINEDVNTYASRGRRGELFFTALRVQLDQLPTQSNAGGMTDIYMNAGTYVKSFYTIMFAPSCVKITTMGRKARRLHHQVNWGTTVPKIISEAHRKSAA